MMVLWVNSSGSYEKGILQDLHWQFYDHKISQDFYWHFYDSEFSQGFCWLIFVMVLWVNFGGYEKGILQG